MIHNRHTLRVTAVNVSRPSDIRIAVAACFDWADYDRASGKKIAVIKVSGDVSDKGSKWPEEWLFEWGEDEMRKLENDLYLIEEAEASRMPSLRIERWSAPCEWLRIGVVIGQETFEAYATFTKDNLSLRAVFDDIGGLSEFSNALHRALFR